MPSLPASLYHEPQRKTDTFMNVKRNIPAASSPLSTGIYALLVPLFLALFITSAHAQNTAQRQPTILYGAAYYEEYMPADLQPGRLEKDVALMKQAGISVVRMGQSTWSLWEPEDGHFDYAWMDRIVKAMGDANIKVIMGTPTYSVPTWMAHAHPEILARYQGADKETTYGMRQNMNTVED